MVRVFILRSHAGLIKSTSTKFHKRRVRPFLLIVGEIIQTAEGHRLVPMWCNHRLQSCDMARNNVGSQPRSRLVAQIQAHLGLMLLKSMFRYRAIGLVHTIRMPT